MGCRCSETMGNWTRMQAAWCAGRQCSDNTMQSAFQHLSTATHTPFDTTDTTAAPTHLHGTPTPAPQAAPQTAPTRFGRHPPAAGCDHGPHTRRSHTSRCCSGPAGEQGRVGGQSGQWSRSASASAKKGGGHSSACVLPPFSEHQLRAKWRHSLHKLCLSFGNPRQSSFHNLPPRLCSPRAVHAGAARPSARPHARGSHGRLPPPQTCSRGNLPRCCDGGW